MSASVVSSQQRSLHYDRVSTVIQSKVGYSGGADGFQIERCRAYTTAHDLTCIGEVTDVDSGAKWNTAGIMEALDRARRREYEVLVVSDTSRFARNSVKKVVYEAEFERYGVAVRYTNLPDLPTTDSPEARLTKNVMGSLYGALDEYDRDKRTWWTSQGRRKKAQLGRVVGGGPPPYGYQYVTEWVEARNRDVPIGLRYDQEQRAVVERIYRDVRRMSAADIAIALSDEGVVPPASWEPSEKRPRSGRWSKSTVRRMLTSALYRGEWHFGDIPVAVPAIIDEVTWHATQRLYVERRPSRRGRTPDRAGAWLLRGRLTCGHCDGAISTDSSAVPGPSARRWPDGRQRRYGCARSVPSRAKLNGWDLCVLPGLLAADERSVAEDGERRRSLVGIEELAWAAVTRFLQDESLVMTMLRQIEDEQAHAREQWAGRLTTIDEQIAIYARRMRRAQEEKQDIEKDDERYADWDEREQQAAAVLKRLRAERADYVAPGAPGLTDEHRTAILALREQIGDLLAEGAEVATAEERRAVFELLNLRGTVHQDTECGLRVGRDARVVVRWQLLCSDAGFLKLGLLHSSSGLTLTTLSSDNDDLEQSA